jgi:hypothetical protein
MQRARRLPIVQYKAYGGDGNPIRRNFFRAMSIRRSCIAPNGMLASCKITQRLGAWFCVWLFPMPTPIINCRFILSLPGTAWCATTSPAFLSSLYGRWFLQKLFFSTPVSGMLNILIAVMSGLIRYLEVCVQHVVFLVRRIVIRLTR